MLAVEVTRRRVDMVSKESLMRALQVISVLLVVSICALALAAQWWLALLLYCVERALHAGSQPLYYTWLNLHIDQPHVRATIFSINSQMDAIGQVFGGPTSGAVGERLGLRAGHTRGTQRASSSSCSDRWERPIGELSCGESGEHSGSPGARHRRRGNGDKRGERECRVERRRTDERHGRRHTDKPGRHSSPMPTPLMRTIGRPEWTRARLEGFMGHAFHFEMVEGRGGVMYDNIDWAWRWTSSRSSQSSVSSTPTNTIRISIFRR